MQIQWGLEGYDIRGEFASGWDFKWKSDLAIRRMFNTFIKGMAKLDLVALTHEVRNHITRPSKTTSMDSQDVDDIPSDDD